MIRSMSSMSAVMPLLSCGSAPAISSPRRRRASGVRRSCETPARISARSSSRRARSRAIWLKACETVWISAGPDSSSGAGNPAAPDVRGRAGQRSERPAHAEDDEKRAEQRERRRQHRPPEPLQGEAPLHPLARQHHPVFVVLDPEAHPERLDPVARERDPRVAAELAADLGDRELQHRPVRRRAGQALVRFGRVDPDAFAFGEIDQQLAAQIRSRRDERRAREVDDADDHLRDLLRARLALVGAEDLEVRRDRGEDQRGDQQERAPEEGAREERHSIGRKGGPLAAPPGQARITFWCRPARRRSRSPRRSG